MDFSSFISSAGSIMSVEMDSSPGEASPDWLKTPRGRRDLLFIATFVLLNVLIPLLIMDLYPFSRAPMFADAPQLYCDYQLFDPRGNALDVLDFGLHRNYWGNPVGEGVGFIAAAYRGSVWRHWRPRGDHHSYPNGCANGLNWPMWK